MDLNRVDIDAIKRSSEHPRNRLSSDFKPYDEAKAAGDRYYLGLDCKQGHRGVRYVSSKTCVECECNTKTNMVAARIRRNIEDRREREIFKAQAGEIWELTA